MPRRIRGQFSKRKRGALKPQNIAGVAIKRTPPRKDHNALFDGVFVERPRTSKIRFPNSKINSDSLNRDWIMAVFETIRNRLWAAPSSYQQQLEDIIRVHAVDFNGGG